MLYEAAAEKLGAISIPSADLRWVKSGNAAGSPRDGDLVDACETAL